MRKLYTVAVFGVLSLFGPLTITGCSDDSSSSNTELIESSSSLGVITSSEVIITSSGDTVNIVDTSKVTIYVEDTTGKELHYVGNSAIRITEIMPGNLTFLDADGEDPGWVELYNGGAEPADLRGYSIVENLEKPRKWIIDSLIIPAGGLRVVFCSKKNITAQTYRDSVDRHWRLATNWKLEKEGGSVYLIDYNWGIRDSVNYPELEPGISWGIVSGGEWRYFSTPTPEKKNSVSTGYDGFVEAVSLLPSGFFNEEFTLYAPSASSGGTVRCTFDGSVPTESSSTFESKRIDENTVVRCAEFVDGKISNKIATSTYFVGETVAMPVVSISVDPEFFTKHYIQPSAGSVNASTPSGAPSGLYEDVEYPVHVEYFENGSNSSSTAFEIEAGMSLMGNYSRLERKKSVAIVMREEYQDGKLDYPLFETRKDENHKFKGFNLRNNGNRFVSDYIEDAMGGALLEGTGVDYQRSRQVVVFYNGKYFGIHDMREHYNRRYVETNYGISSDEVEMVKHLGHSITASGEGSTASYENLLSFVYSNDFSGSDNAAYESVKGMMDVGNYADYMIAEMYEHNGDWPNNNVRAWRSANQPWKFMVYDLDHGFDWNWTVSGFDGKADGTNMFKWVKQGGNTSNSCTQSAYAEKCFHTLFVKLIKNPDFKRMFANRAAVLFQNNLNATRVSAVVDAMAETLVSSETTRDLEYNGQKSRYYSNTCGNGFSISGSCLKTWSETRDGVVWNEYISEFGFNSGSISVTIAASGNGSVKVDGITLPSTNYTGKFFNGNQMKLTAVPDGNAVFSAWEDGTRDNPRLVTPADGASYKATFK